MKATLHHSEDAPWQQLDREWFGNPVTPPFEFRFRLTADSLIFSARRRSPALLHPQAQEGVFQDYLWKYDTAEFFVATEAADRYLEFNICPNGAWWSAAFTDPRVVNEAVPAVPEGVRCSGTSTAEGWECEAHLPLAYLALMGIEPGNPEKNFRLTAAAILESPQQLFLTTSPDTSGKPDFHRPWAWEEAAQQA